LCVCLSVVSLFLVSVSISGCLCLYHSVCDYQCVCVLAVQGTLKSLLQHHSSKASVLWCSAFFMVQLSHPYITTGKTITLTTRTFVGKVMSLLFNMLSRLVITFLPRNKCLNFMAAVTIFSDFGAPQNKVCHCFHCFHIYLPWSDGMVGWYHWLNGHEFE